MSRPRCTLVDACVVDRLATFTTKERETQEDDKQEEGRQTHMVEIHMGTSACGTAEARDNALHVRTSTIRFFGRHDFKQHK